MSVCVHNNGRSNTKAAAELAELKKTQHFKEIFNEHPIQPPIFQVLKIKKIVFVYLKLDNYVHKCMAPPSLESNHHFLERIQPC